MFYYKRNIGDYAKKAGRLSMLQHGAYTLLIDACYDREQFPTMEEAIEWTWASNAQEIEAVQFVLRKFFDCVDGRYVQDRIREEVETYQRNCENNSRIATEREERRRGASPMRARSVHEAPPNQEPRTINQENPLVADATVIELPKKAKPQPSEEDFTTARWLAGKQKSANPTSKDPSVEGWAQDVRLMRTIDGRTHKEICELFRWAKADDFWAPNIQSPGTLRKQWDKLTEKRVRAAPAAPGGDDWLKGAI
jgi:uncharacterized protein YdaU (DUF1376 family)